MANKTSLEGKVAIITGGASGIGKASVLLFLERGASVVAADFNAEGLAALAAEVGSDKLATFEVNVADREKVEAMIDFAVATFGKLDIVFNNAGIMDGFEMMHEVEDAKWDRVFDINVKGVMYASRKAIQYFLERGEGGVIVNTVSVGGLNGGRAGVTYGASKHAVAGITKAIGFEYARKGIRCVGIAPGAVATNIQTSMGNVSQEGYGACQPGMALIPGAGEPEQLAEAAAWAASDSASYVNGTVITVDGGWTAF